MGRKKETIVANTDKLSCQIMVAKWICNLQSRHDQESWWGSARSNTGFAGYIPNFAKKGIDTGGKSIKDSKIWRNATDGYPKLSVDAESLGGFGMISIKGILEDLTSEKAKSFWV